MHLTMIATRYQSCRFKYYSYISCQTKLALNGRRKNLYTTKHEQPPTMADIFHRASIVAELLRPHFLRLVGAILQAHSLIVSAVTFQFAPTRTHLRRHCACSVQSHWSHWFPFFIAQTISANTSTLSAALTTDERRCDCGRTKTSISVSVIIFRACYSLKDDA